MAHREPKKRKLDHSMALAEPRIIARVSECPPQISSPNNTSIKNEGLVPPIKNHTEYLDVSRDLSMRGTNIGAVSNVLRYRLQELLLKVRNAREPGIDNIENILQNLKAIMESIPNQQGISVGLTLSMFRELYQLRSIFF